MSDTAPNDVDGESIEADPPPTNRPTRLAAWAQLVRLPNVFTVIADVAAAFLLVSQGPEPLARFICVILAGVTLYWAGMVLNDVFDVEKDRSERATRPIPAGAISLQEARTGGWLLLLVGIGLAALSGYLPGSESSWLPAAVGIVLAAMIVAYDGPLKRTPLAPAAMGSCRVLSFLLGAAPTLVMTADGPLFPKYVVGIALGFGVYIMGVTTMARHEATGGPSPNLSTGLLVTIMGSAILAFAPQMATQPMGWHVSTERVFPIMIGMIVFPVLIRGFRATREPTPMKIQMTIRVGIFTIIPLAASFAFLGAGPIWGVVICMLTIPSIILSLKFRVT